jgi:hypothetical protein
MVKNRAQTQPTSPGHFLVPTAELLQATAPFGPSKFAALWDPHAVDHQAERFSLSPCQFWTWWADDIFLNSFILAVLANA